MEMIKGTRNQLGNLKNQYQTNAKKVLTVCSAGMLRSPTLANVLHAEYGFNTRSCGATDFALIPITEALILWADEIVCVHSDVVDYFSKEEYELVKPKLFCLNIPDEHEWNNEDLKKICIQQYDKRWEVK
jgi:predicted protein tyrosine phosphatase